MDTVAASSSSYLTFHFAIEGMIETSIMSAETKKIMWTEFRKLPMIELEIASDDVRNEPANNCSAACTGMRLVIIRNTKPILNAFPVMTKLVLIPADAPLL